MAIAPELKLEGVGEVDPTEEAAIRQVKIRAPHPHAFSDPKAELLYDRPSDIMLVFFHGRDRDSFVANVLGDYAVLLDTDTEEIVGIQIDDYMHSAVKDDPWLIKLLDYADLRGMTVADVRQERHRALGYRGRFKLWAEGMVETVLRRGEPHPQHLFESLLYRGQFGSTIRDALGSA